MNLGVDSPNHVFYVAIFRNKYYRIAIQLLPEPAQSLLLAGAAYDKNYYVDAQAGAASNL